LGDTRRHSWSDVGYAELRADLAPADKIVYSKSLEIVSTPKTRLEREFDPQVVRDLKAQLPHDVSVGGPTLAAHAIQTGLVDEYHLFVVPMMIGGGKRVLPSNVCAKLDLLDERRFANGMVYLRSHAGLMEAEGRRRVADRCLR
jgi:riboflavin biosynthesis pyrimidine reductase